MMNSTDRRHTLSAIIVLGAVILLCFLPTLPYEILKFDSTKYLLEDRAIRVFDWEHISHILTSYYFVNYNPLQRISYMLDRAVWGVEPGGFRGTNILLHWTASVFVFLLFRALTEKPSVGWVTAVVFAIHPTRVESVVWLAQRKDVLAAAFGFCALWLYVKFIRANEHERPGEPMSGIGWYFAALLSAAGALASKAQWVPLCVALVTCDLYVKHRLTGRRLVLHLPFFSLCGFFAWVAIDAQVIQGQKGAAAVVTFGERLLTPFAGFGLYIYKSVFPVGLCPRYPEALAASPLLAAAGLVTVLGWAVLGLWKRREHPEVLFGFIWFVAFLLPVLNVLPGNLPPADRYLYVAVLGPFFPVAVRLGRFKPVAIGAVTAVLGLVWIGLTIEYRPAWRNDRALWTRVVEQYPDHPFGLAQLGFSQMDAGDWEASRATFDRARRLPTWFVATISGSARLAAHFGENAETIYLEGLRRFPTSPDAKAAYGTYLLSKQRFAEAERFLLEADKLRSTPETKEALARLYEETDRIEPALEYLRPLLYRDPFNENHLTHRGRLRERLNRLEDAEADYQLAVALAPESEEPWFRLARLAFQRGDLTETVDLLEEMRRTRTDGGELPAPALNLLAAAHHRRGALLPALVAMTEATRVEPTAPYLINLARLEIEAVTDPRPTLERARMLAPEREAELRADPVFAPFFTPNRPSK